MALMVLLPLLSGPDSPATALLGDLLFDCLNCAVDVMQEVTGERYTSVQAVAADVVRAYTRQQCSVVMPPHVCGIAVCERALRAVASPYAPSPSITHPPD